MGFTFINKLPTPAEIREQFPLALSWRKSNMHGTRK